MKKLIAILAALWIARRILWPSTIDHRPSTDLVDRLRELGAL